MQNNRKKEFTNRDIDYRRAPKLNSQKEYN